MIEYRHARIHSTVQNILNEESAKHRRLKSVVMGDMTSRYDMYFEDSGLKYEYVHEHTRFSNKVPKIIEDYENRGYKLAFHVMGDLFTRNELFFEKIVG